MVIRRLAISKYYIYIYISKLWVYIYIYIYISKLWVYILYQSKLWVVARFELEVRLPRIVRGLDQFQECP